MNKSERILLDKLRWSSAALVAVGHAFGIFNNRAEGSSLINFIADGRGMAVTIFFVLSGYLIAGKIISGFESFDWVKYSISRFSRIYTVLVPTLFLTLMLDGLVYLIDPASPVYAGVWQGGALGDKSIFSRYQLLNFVGSILSIEPLTGRPIGSAGSLWSLGYEWIFYFMFPILFGAGFKFRGKVGAALLVGVSILVIAAWSKVSALYWIVWLLGGICVVIERAIAGLPRRVLLLAKVISVLIVVSFIFVGPQYVERWSVLIVALGTAGIIVTGDVGEERFNSKMDIKLAKFSYSLYAIHLQIMSFCAAVLVYISVLPLSGFSNPVVVFAFSAVVVAISYLTAYYFGVLFEDRTKMISGQLGRLIGRGFRHGADRSAPRQSNS